MVVSNLAIRIIIYQIILFNFYFDYQNLSKSSLEFKDKLYLNANYFGFKLDFANNLLKNPYNLYLIIIFIQLFAAFSAILGSKIGAFFTAFLFSIHTLLFNNPALLENKANSFFGLKFEFFLNLGIIIVMMMDAFSKSSKQESVQKIESQTNNPSETGSSAKKGNKKRI